MKSKISAILLAVSLIPTLSFASSKLTYDEAFKTSINNNLSIERGTDVVENIQNTLQTGIPTQSLDQSGQYYQNESNPVSSITQSMQYQSLIDNEQISKQSLSIQKDAISINLKALFIKIQNLEENNKLINEKITNPTKLVTYIILIFFLMSSVLNSFFLSPIVGFSTSFPK